MASLVKVDENAQVQVVIPTAINMVLMVNENLVSNLRKAQASNIVLPSIYKRAFLVVGETDEMAVVRQGINT